MLFHWLAALEVDAFLCECVMWEYFFGRRDVALVFRESAFFLNRLIGYADLTVFHEIWSEHSLLAIKQKCVGEFHDSKGPFIIFEKGGGVVGLG